MAGSSTLLRSCQRLFQMMSESNSFENVVKNAQVTAASPGKVVCELTVDENCLNRVGGIHGGFTAALVDQMSAMSLMTKEHLPGVSVDLNVSYLNTAKVGDLLEVRAECLKYGKSLAFTTVDILRKSDETLIATGRQTNHTGDQKSMAANSVLRNCQKILQWMIESKSFDSRILNNVQITAASPEKIVCEKTVGEADLNAMGAIHGGVTASLVDQITTLSILTVEGRNPGSTVDLNVSYLKSAKAGDVLELRAECLKYGKSLAFTTMDVVKKSDGTLVATGRQTKHVAIK